MSSKDLEQVVTKLVVLGEKLDRGIDRYRKASSSKDTASLISRKIEELRTSWTEFDASDTKVRELVLRSKSSFTHEFLEKDRYGEIEAKYLAYLSELTDALTRLSPNENSASTATNQTVIHTQSNNNQLPRINLPKFNGEYASWRSFHDLFVSIVHNNFQIPPVQKLHYLKGCLSGEAERLLKNIPIADEYYNPAWEKLKKRYENKRLLVHTQLRTLVNQPKLVNESGKGIKFMMDSTEECIQQLKILKVDVSSWDTLVIFLLVQKLPPVTLKLWEEELGDSDALPDLKQFLKFLNTRFRILESMSMNLKPSPTTTKTYHVTSSPNCPACGGEHYVGICRKFSRMNAVMRKQCIEEAKRCLNCFSSKHSVGQCPSPRKCKECNSAYHTLLHIRKRSPNSSTTSTHQSNVSQKPSASMSIGESSSKDHSPSFSKEESKSFIATETQNALLATALVKMQDKHGNSVILRCLVDPGSQTSFMTDSACKRLGLKGIPMNIEITGLNKSKTAWSYKQVRVKMSSCHNQMQSFVATMLVISKITDHLPNVPVDVRRWNHFEDLELADPSYWKPGPIDILLGAKEYSTILLDGVRRGKMSAPIAINTILGWIILGKYTESSFPGIQSFSITAQSNNSLNELLKKFWESEEVYIKPSMKPDDKECEDNFRDKHLRLPNGRYQVDLPFVKGKEPTLGPSRHLAVKRYLHLLKRFGDNPAMKEEYTKCLDEYVTLGHMEAIPPSAIEDANAYYIPHHAVWKESTTTKLRVVFDASAKSQNGKSLNEQLLTGPTIQPKLFATLMKWRKYKFAITADIEKMYRMIEVNPKHRNYQRIIWQNPQTRELQDFQLKTVTFGTSSAPYLAIRTLQQLGMDERTNFPLASRAVMTDFYVDDLLSGADTIDQAKELQRQCIEMLSRGGFNLRKWASNRVELLDNIPEEHREVKGTLSFDEHNTIKTLGIHWHPGSDYFTFTLNTKKGQIANTKRSILSEIASLYDPLGWISPIIIIAKIIIQSLWITGCSWDDQVSPEIFNQWHRFQEELQHITSIRIPRWVGTSQTATRIQIHGFCDASIKAFAAVIYIRTEDSSGSVRSTMLTSKTRVAPIKPTTLPRLELNGALLLAKLIESTIKDMQLEGVPVFAWTDSLIALQWIRSHPSKWKTYVANRVAEIQDMVDPRMWKHVPTNHNPADLASRGVHARDLINNNLWWHGPEWLLQSEKEWPQLPMRHEQPAIEAKDPPISLILTKTNKEFLEVLTRYSSFLKLNRIMAYVQRFLHNSRKNNTQLTGRISVAELKSAANTIFKLTQGITFAEEYQALRKKEQISHKSRLLNLNPFLDENEVMRVGGRLDKANIPYERKHPIILSSDHHITNILIDQIHKDTLHGGIALVLNTSRHLYWIVNAKRAIRKRINCCKTCIIYRKENRCQLMGELPANRVNVSKPFTHVGIDYAGPINLKTSPHRVARVYKGYFCIFVCMATKAIHLELVSDMTTAAFMAALKRFISRRGLPSDIYSDCGTNFKGADRCLSADLSQAVKNATPDVEIFLSKSSVTWHFNPPASPHFGGLWEAGVKSVKYHLRRVIGTSLLTYEEYATLLAQVEACVNSRPLCTIGNEIDDLLVLTPGHFLIGQELNAYPQPETKEVTPSQRWKYIQYITRQFWRKWSGDYLHQLQQRTKWHHKQDNVKVGDLVLLKEDNTPPAYWPIGKIESVYPGIDGLVRVVDVQTNSNKFRRPIGKVCLLPQSETED